ncbi:MAG: type III PLP-dependent enzyme [Pseudomonadota bacterium]
MERATDTQGSVSQEIETGDVGCTASKQSATLADQLVEASFGTRGADLTVGGVSARDLADTYGTPLYVYDAALLRENYKNLSEAVSGFAEIYYSVKANPRRAIAETFVGEGAGLEVASAREFDIAVAAGADPSRIIFAGPGKGAHELERAIAGGLGELHLESFEEIEHAARAATEQGRDQEVAIRVNPVAAALGGAMRMGGKPTAFGFDEEILADVVAAVRQYPRLRLGGVHLFAGTQILKADVLLAQWRHGLKIAQRLSDLMGEPVRTIDLGGGLGVPYHDGDKVLDLNQLAQGVPALVETIAQDVRLSDAHIVLEPGRYLTANAGVYLMQVRAVKHSRGERFLICDGGMHHHLAASGNLGQVIKRDYPLVAADAMNDRARSQANVVGPLCTPLDTLGRKTPMPKLSAGQLVGVLQSGAYGVSASPVGFLSHPEPVEVLVDNGTHRAISMCDHRNGQVAEV